ncbi:hypothetical protein CBS101457_000828 [Exobasidium rhododendri]|nr:hypothetical protein CBS101457_000828 [Exobasidium rhododendri]
MHNEAILPNISTSMNRTPKSSFSSRLRLARGPAAAIQNQKQQQIQQQRQQKQQSQQGIRQATPLRQQSSVIGTDTGSSILFPSSSASHGPRKHHKEPTQHPSHYPPSALYALEQASLTLSPSVTNSHVQGKSLSQEEAGVPLHSHNQASSFNPSDTRAIPTLQIAPIHLETYLRTSKAYSSSPRSDSSSEFSLSAAFPDEENAPTTVVQVPAGITEDAVDDNRNRDYSTKGDSTPTSQTMNPFLRVASPVHTLEDQAKARHAKPVNTTEDWNYEDYEGARVKYAMRRRSKSTLSNVLIQEKDDGSEDDDSSTSRRGPNGVSLTRLRLRSIASASQIRTHKSPPPPKVQSKRTRATNFPPSPMTPRPAIPPAKSSRSFLNPSGNTEEGNSATLAGETGSSLGTIRPPRPTRRSPSPMHALTADDRSKPCPKDCSPANDDEPIFDFVGGINWEMLNIMKEYDNEITSSQRAATLEEAAARDEEWDGIEQWRSGAGIAYESPVERQELHDERFDETMRPASIDSSPGQGLMPSMTAHTLATARSDYSLATAKSFQSMSSFGRSIFTAVGDSPNPVFDLRSRSPLPSCNPSVVPSPLIVDDRTAFTAKIDSARADLPGTFPGFQSSQSLLYQQTVRPPTSTKVSTSAFRLLQESSFQSPSRTNVSQPSSEVFESADEGLGSEWSPRPIKSSPRKNLTRQYNARKRASRLFGLPNEKAVGLGNSILEDEEIRGQSPFSLTTAQLMAFSQEAEVGSLDTAELQKKHEYLLTTDEDTLKEGDLRTPDLWRQSQTSKEDESLITPVSDAWEAISNSRDDQRKALRAQDYDASYPEETNEHALGLHTTANEVETRLDSTPAPPTRPIIKRRSKRISCHRSKTEEPLARAINTTFIKLSSLPIQLVEAPSQISWRSSLTAQEFNGFAATFGSKEMHRQEVIEELLITEWNFVTNLNSILRIFSLPLRNADLSFSREVPLDVARLFNWLDDILAFHVKLLKSLDKVKSRHPSALIVSIAGTLHKHISGLSIHQSYLVNFERVTKLIDNIRRSEIKADLSSFDHIIERQSRLPECRGMGLSSFLLKPVQRLMKYPLFFKQLAELTPADHPDHEETQQLCVLTEKIIRDMNCVKAREEDYQELKVLASRIKGLPEDFHLASRQRHLFKQGVLRSVALTEPSSSLSNPFDRSFGHASPTLSSSQIRPLGLSGSGISANLQSPRIGNVPLPSVLDDSPSLPWQRSPTPSDVSYAGTKSDTKMLPFQSSLSSTGVDNNSLFEIKRSTTPQPPPLRPASRKTSMANLFARSHAASQGHGKQSSHDEGEGTTMHAFVFDDLLLLTIPDREDEKEGTTKTAIKQSKNKKKQGNQGLQASPTLSQLGEDSAKYIVLPKGGVCRILGVTARSSGKAGGTSSSLVSLLEVEVLPLTVESGEGSRSSGSTGSMTFLFAFADDAGHHKGGGGGGGAELCCSLWEKALEKSFLSCIQARKKQSLHTLAEFTSPIFGAIVKPRVTQHALSLNTAQADWPRRQEHVKQVVMNAARCGDRTTLTALLQAGLPFPRSPSQQSLSDLANRTVATVENKTLSPSRLERALPAPPPPPPLMQVHHVQKSPSQPASSRRSPNLGISGQSHLEVSEVARVGDLGSTKTAVRTLDEERREEKTWWCLRMKEIEAEGEWNDALEKLVASRRARLQQSQVQAAVTSSTNTSTSMATRVRKGLPVLK